MVKNTIFHVSFARSPDSKIQRFGLRSLSEDSTLSGHPVQRPESCNRSVDDEVVADGTGADASGLVNERTSEGGSLGNQWHGRVFETVRPQSVQYAADVHGETTASHPFFGPGCVTVRGGSKIRVALRRRIVRDQLGAASSRSRDDGLIDVSSSSS